MCASLLVSWSQKIAPILEGVSLLHHPLNQKEPPENDCIVCVGCTGEWEPGGAEWVRDCS